MQRQWCFYILLGISSAGLSCTSVSPLNEDSDIGTDVSTDSDTTTEAASEQFHSTETERPTDADTASDTCLPLDEAACEQSGDCVSTFAYLVDMTIESHVVGCGSPTTASICTSVQSCSDGAVFMFDTNGDCWWFADGCAPALEGWRINETDTDCMYAQLAMCIE